MINELLNRANVLTYLGLIFAVVGISLCFIGNLMAAATCIFICGVCDGFDGTVAKKLRVKGNPEFGVQLDSLVDIISSGMFPVIFALSAGYNDIIAIIIYAIFVVAGVTRLSYYNINSKEDGAHFVGIPITVTTIIIPIIYLLLNYEISFLVCFMFLAIMFVVPLKVKKLTLCQKIILSIIGLVIMGILIYNGVNNG